MVRVTRSVHQPLESLGLVFSSTLFDCVSRFVLNFPSAGVIMSDGNYVEFERCAQIS